jgi:hypothetical protein
VVPAAVVAAGERLAVQEGDRRRARASTISGKR